MKRNFLSIFLSAALFFLLPLSSAYSSYNIIAEADFFGKGVKFEAVDIENLLLDKQNLFGMIFHPFSPVLFLQNNFLEPFFDFSLSTPATYPTFPILRC
jgi:hypothetical protein